MPGSAGWRSNGGWGTSGSAPAIARASSRPSSVRGTSVRPVCRRSTLHSVAPWRTRISCGGSGIDPECASIGQDFPGPNTCAIGAVVAMVRAMAISCTYCGGVHDSPAQIRQCWNDGGRPDVDAERADVATDVEAYAPDDFRTAETRSAPSRPSSRPRPRGHRAGGVPARRGRGASRARRPRPPRARAAGRIGSGAVALGRAHPDHPGDTRRADRGVRPSPARGDRPRATRRRTRDRLRAAPGGGHERGAVRARPAVQLRARRTPPPRLVEHGRRARPRIARRGSGSTSRSPLVRPRFPPALRETSCHPTARPCGSTPGRSATRSRSTMSPWCTWWRSNSGRSRPPAPTGRTPTSPPTNSRP